MNNFTKQNIRNEAARIGFFNKSLKNLTSFVKKNIQEVYSQDEKRLELKSIRYQYKTMNQTSQIEHLEIEYKKSPIVPAEFAVGLLGFILLGVLAQTGIFITGIMGLFLVSLGFVGCIILRFHEIKNPSWRPILFTSLSVIGGIIVFSSLIENDKSVTQALMACMVTGINIYVMNSTILDSSRFLINESKKIIIVIKKFIHHCFFRFWSAKNSRYNRCLAILQRHKETEYNKLAHLIELEYLIGKTARETKELKIEKPILQSILSEEIKYAN